MLSEKSSQLFDSLRVFRVISTWNKGIWITHGRIWFKVDKVINVDKVVKGVREELSFSTLITLTTLSFFIESL